MDQIKCKGRLQKKKMCKFCDILQIGWGGPGLKTHFKKDRNCDKVFGGVGEKRQCHNFHMLNICCFIGYKQHNWCNIDNNLGTFFPYPSLITSF